MKIRLSTLGAWLLVCLLAGACAPAVTPAALQPVRFCYNATSGSQAAAWYAYEKGIFQKYGLEPELVFITGGPNLVAVLLQGEADFCNSAGSNVVNAVAAGEDLVLLAGYYDRYLFELVVGPDIQTAEDLIGKTIGTGSIPGLKVTAAYQALRHLGLDPETQVSYTAFANNDEAVMAAAVESGSIAGAVLAPPLLGQYEAAGLRVLVDISEVDSYYQRLGLVTTRSYLAGHHDQAVAVMKTLLDSMAQMRKDPAGTQAVLAQYLELDPTADAATLAKVYDIFVVRYLLPVPHPSEAGLQAAIDEALVGNPDVAGVTVAQLMDASILQEVEDSGFIATLPSY